MHITLGFVLHSWMEQSRRLSDIVVSVNVLLVTNTLPHAAVNTSIRVFNVHQFYIYMFSTK